MAPNATSTRPQFLRSISGTSLKSTRDKPRLYVALYPRGGQSTAFRRNSTCDSYHWALVVGLQTAARTDPGTRHHVVHPDDSSHRYFYEEQDIPLNAASQQCLVRITICKVTDVEHLQQLLRNLPVREDDPSFTCVSWVRAAFRKLHNDGRAIKSYLKVEDWDDVETCARKYCKRKRDTGRFQEDATTNDDAAAATWDATKISTFNYWENRETSA